MELYNEEIQKVLVAALLGAVIGLEREWSGKPAGLRTIVLVSAGAALFTIISYEITSHDVFGVTDTSRIASNIVTGIGFLGAGIIFQGRNNVHGLTTAATVWTGAAIGMAAGVGNYNLAIVTTAIVLIVLVLLHKAEFLLLKFMKTMTYKVRFHETEQKKDVSYEDYFNEKGYKLKETKYDKHEGAVIVYWTVTASHKKHEVAVDKLLHDESIIELNYN